jgi:hypothetical protein
MIASFLYTFWYVWTSLSVLIQEIWFLATLIGDQLVLVNTTTNSIVHEPLTINDNYLNGALTVLGSKQHQSMWQAGMIRNCLHFSSDGYYCWHLPRLCVLCMSWTPGSLVPSPLQCFQWCSKHRSMMNLNNTHDSHSYFVFALPIWAVCVTFDLSLLAFIHWAQIVLLLATIVHACQQQAKCHQQHTGYSHICTYYNNVNRRFAKLATL